MEDEFNKIDSQCKVIKRRLATSVKDIDRVEECLNKKNYLLKLRAETAKYRDEERSLVRLLESKEELKKALGVFDS